MSRDLGQAFVDLHHRHGVRTYFGIGVEEVARESGSLRLLLTDGTCLSADVVVVGMGTTVNDDWLQSSGLLLEDGVVCDQYSRAESHPRVHAVGDIARWHHPRHHELVRVEHWTNAVDQATCVAHNISHPDDLRAYEPVEYVWTDQYDRKVQIAGRPWRAASTTLLGSQTWTSVPRLCTPTPTEVCAVLSR